MTWRKTAADRKQDNQRYGTTWRAARKTQLERHPLCQVQLTGCTHIATEVDHTIGAGQDPDHRHLRSICTHCHRKITAQQGRGWRGRSHSADPQPKPSTTW